MSVPRRRMAQLISFSSHVARPATDKYSSPSFQGSLNPPSAPPEIFRFVVLHFAVFFPRWSWKIFSANIDVNPDCEGVVAACLPPLLPRKLRRKQHRWRSTTFAISTARRSADFFRWFIIFASVFFSLLARNNILGDNNHNHNDVATYSNVAAAMIWLPLSIAFASSLTFVSPCSYSAWSSRDLRFWDRPYLR